MLVNLNGIIGGDTSAIAPAYMPSSQASSKTNPLGASDFYGERCASRKACIQR